MGELLELRLRIGGSCERVTRLNRENIFVVECCALGIS